MKILVFILLLFQVAISFAGKPVKLNWEFEFKPEKNIWIYDYHDKAVGVNSIHFHRDSNSSITKNYMAMASVGNFKVIKAELRREHLILTLIVHNPSETEYQCVYFTSGEDSAYMDDELGNEYKGAIITFANELDNKLAINQRKKVEIKIPRPDEDADLVNFHFGVTFVATKSQKKCADPIVNWKMNFHKLNWDSAILRTE